MTYRFKVSPRAERQIRTAASWWRKHRTAAATLLTDELDAAFNLIEELPLASEAVPNRRLPGLHRILLDRTQYYLYYVVAEDAPVIEILALWHTSRGRAPRL